MIRRRTSLTLLVLLTLSATCLIGCAQPRDTLKVGASASPHAEILEFVKPILAEQGITLEIKIFNDYVQPNLALDRGEIDANFFQHQPYLETFCRDHNLQLVALGKVHIEPLGIYSRKVGALSELNDGITIPIPNDVVQTGRALALLQAAGLIELKDGVGTKGTLQDIVSNPKKLRVLPLDAPQLPRVLDDPQVGAAVINGNFALEAGLNPSKDAIYLENSDSPYANVLAVRADRQDEKAIVILNKALQSEATKKFIQEQYQGAIIVAR